MKYTSRLTLLCKHAALVALLVAAAAPAARAQAETWQPWTLSAWMVAARVWSAGGRTFARVNLTLPSPCYRVLSVGPVTRQGNDVSVDFLTEEFTGACVQIVILKEYFLDLGALEPGAYTFTVRSRGTPVRSVAFDPSQAGERWEEGSAPDGVSFAVWTAGGVTFAAVGINFPDEGYRLVEWKEPARAGNDFVSRVRLERWTGRASVFVRGGAHRIFSLGVLPPDETFTVTVEFTDGVRRTSFPFTPAGTARPAHWHPLDDPAFFVRQHYLDFLGREPDAEGLAFWFKDLATNCSTVPSPCLDARRVNVSAAFFLSIEFQRTGFYVYRMHKAAFGRMPRMNEFFADTRRTAAGVVVGREGWEALLDENRRRFGEEFVARDEFRARYPDTLTPAQYVDALNHNISHPWRETEPGALSAAERERLVQGLIAGTETRATVLRKMAEHPEFVEQEVNRAFVLMQYFGYLRRNPDEGPDSTWDGYNFWLTKLNFFRGNFVEAEMVKAFLDSIEYRRRFKQ